MTITTNWESPLEKAPYITTVSLRLPVWIHRACWLPRSSSSRTRPRKSTSAQRLMTMTPNRESSLENPPYITTISLRLPVWIHRACWLTRSSSSRTRPIKSTSAQRLMTMTPNRESSLENPPYITTVSLRLVWMNKARLSHLLFWGPSEGFFLINSTAVGLTRMKRPSFGLWVRVNPWVHLGQRFIRVNPTDV